MRLLIEGGSYCIDLAMWCGLYSGAAYNSGRLLFRTLRYIAFFEIFQNEKKKKLVEFILKFSVFTLVLWLGFSGLMYDVCINQFRIPYFSSANRKKLSGLQRYQQISPTIYKL